MKKIDMPKLDYYSLYYIVDKKQPHAEIKKQIHQFLWHNTSTLYLILEAFCFAFMDLMFVVVLVVLLFILK